MKKFIDQKYSAYKKLMSNVRVILYLKEWAGNDKMVSSLNIRKVRVRAKLQDKVILQYLTIILSL
jgi:uncharacterized protein (UPF0333 family)